MTRTKKSIKLPALILIIIFVLTVPHMPSFAQAGGGTFSYTVAGGDTFYSLSLRFDTSIADISAMNPGVSPDNLSIGTRLRITAGDGVYIYFIQSGDTLSRIAVKFNSTVGALTRQNYIRDPNMIYTGEVLAVPVTYRFPGEFERQQAIWMQWPSEVYNSNGRPVNPTMVNIIQKFSPYTAVNLMVRSTDEMNQVQSIFQSSGFSGNNVTFYVMPHLSIWARDVGPLYLKDNLNNLGVADFDFNNYGRGGNQYYIQGERQVDSLTAQWLGLPVISSNMVSEGGAIESNGSGTIMVTESVALSRNPGMSKQQIEAEYKRVLGVKKILWLKKGLSEDDAITGGHINEIARFANPDTILLAQVLPDDRYANSNSSESYLRMEENYNILSNSTDQDGRPFRIIRIPMPPTLYNVPDSVTGKIPLRSYLNYAVTNGAVLMQSYWKPGRADTLRSTEAQVKSILQSVYPGRDIIGVDPESVNLWGGGIHCVTQHMPAK